ncbi:hypothetical protein EXIGUO8H_20762 [Exiguobacterium sp. 8H]|nr:hypothetical protein EXIGUO8A_11829 [Exiguobacterium sp. 8A]VXB69557.1 hypothetical protein EXIGUO8H_20762 [Exiguobacterium sp. 8H]
MSQVTLKQYIKYLFKVDFTFLTYFRHHPFTFVRIALFWIVLYNETRGDDG